MKKWPVSFLTTIIGLLLFVLLLGSTCKTLYWDGGGNLSFLSSTGSTYEVTVKGNLPSDCALAVSEVDSTPFTSILNLSDITYMKFLDISLIQNGVEVEPSDEVEVDIKLAREEQNGEVGRIYHFVPQTQPSSTTQLQHSGESAQPPADGLVQILPDEVPLGSAPVQATPEDVSLVRTAMAAMPVADQTSSTVADQTSSTVADQTSSVVTNTPMYDGAGVSDETHDQIQAGSVVEDIEFVELASFSGNSVSFKTSSFSVYGVIYTIQTNVLTADGQTYSVSVSYEEDAGIPNGTNLLVSEVLEGTDAYEEAKEASMRSLSDETRIALISQMRVFDISFVYEGEKIEPKAPVQVSVEYAYPMVMGIDSEFQIVHFGSPENDILEAELTDINGGELTGFQFNTDSFSTFSFAEAGYLGSLNGQSFVMVRDLGDSGKIAVMSANKVNKSDRLKGVWVNDSLEEGKLTPVTSENGTTVSNEDLTIWTFEHVRDNIYYVKSDDGKYLTITSSGVTATTQQAEIEVVPCAGTDKKYTGEIYLRSVAYPDNCLNYKVEKSIPGFKNSNYASYYANSRFKLYLSEDSTIYGLTTAKKVSPNELQAAGQYVIYRRVYNEALGKYQYYALAGDGSLVYAYDEGDYVAFRSNAATTWYLIEHMDEDGQPSGYYDFYNTVTHRYLSPSSAGILSDEEVGVLLSGRENGEGNSTIEAWDSSYFSYYGLKLDVDNRRLSSGSGAESETFSFAEIVGIEEGVLHEVDTVDSISRGIKISMYDFSNRNAMNLFSDNTFTENEVNKGLVQNILGSDGLPVSKTGISFSTLYNDSNYKGDANHLFIQSIFDATGYYEYNSFQNSAQYDQATGNFTIYDELTTISNDTGGKTTYLRGNYLPYNHIDITKPSLLTRQYQSTTEFLSLEDPAFDSKLYLTDNIDYYFGTIVEANFLQSKDGKDSDGNPIVYEFTGDDDLWVFIDGVLVLDIGGIHSAIPGYINFSTGKVHVGGSNQTDTTIKQLFKDAVVFPDGTVWNDNLVDNYFTEDTFNDYSGHSFKMFYQERGAGASTLQVSFNLPVIESGTFAVEKKLGGTEQSNYANVQFAYQAYLVQEDGADDVLLRPGLILDEAGHLILPEEASDEQKASAVKVVYENTETNLDFYDDVVIGENEYDGVFYLKPDEVAVFHGIPEEVPYYVKEIDVSGAFFDTVMINEADMHGEGSIPEDENIAAISSEKTIKERQRVLFENICSPANLRDLRITKKVENPCEDGATFEFRVMLEGRNGELIPYSRGDYYIVKIIDDVEHYFTYENGTLTDRGAEPVVCSTSGQYGTIAGIPDGYTVVIKGLLAGTDFKVEEIRNPIGYAMVSKLLEEETYERADLPDADGKIKLRQDAKMTITNHHYSSISVVKTWSGDEDVERHGNITVALYRKNGNNEFMMELGDVLKSNAIQTITSPATNVLWLLDLPEGDTLSDYVVREVIIDEDEIITPEMDSGVITVMGEEMATGIQDNAYSVSYQQGVETVASEIRSREDSVVNARILEKKVSILKVDVSDGKILEGAVFDLYALADDGETRQEPPMYTGLISGEDGYLKDEEDNTIFELPVGTYHLAETLAPDGYVLTVNAITITVTDEQDEVSKDFGEGNTLKGVTYSEGTNLSNSGAGKKYNAETKVYTLKITNSAGVELPATGGITTTPIYLLGILMTAMAAVTLLMKKRSY